MQAETIYRPVFSTLFTLFYNVTFSLFVLVILNALLKRCIPSIAFHPSELLIVYVMLSIATAIFGHDLILVMIQNLSAFWFATPENQWAVLFGKHLPHWLSVVDARALIGYQHGEPTLYNEINLKAWLIPGAFWGGFLIILLLVLICINTIVRKQWTENEKLAYPIIQLPLELARGGTGLLGNRGLWLGFALAGGMDVINGVHGIFPSFPALKPTYDVTPPAVYHQTVERHWLDTGSRLSLCGGVGLLFAVKSFVFRVVFPRLLEVGAYFSECGRNLKRSGTLQEL